MQTKFSMIAVVMGVTALMSSPASGQIEPIAPFDLPAYSETLFGPYLNEIPDPPPDPQEKVFAFVGTAQNPSSEAS